ncbi:MAG: type III pantothenate kinase [Nocardioidaceae bacterium]|nr:type III pantothenate kinase [Nocardioidaceae bacterium]MCL2614799.1 type III pantothenate kinase [Nocardioidaceae bacterium]
MALLAADIGNAHTVLGLVSDGRVSAHWRVSTDARRTADEWAVVLRGVLGEVLDEVDGIAACCTVPSVLNEWREMLARHFGDLRSVIVEPGVRTGIAIQVDNPLEVGTDRVVNALAASDIARPAVVVDFGSTATTFDVIDAHGRYVGGAITPGIEVSIAALSRAGAQLRQVELVRPKGVIGKNTVQALQSGIVFGVASLVEGMVARVVGELGVAPEDVAVISTGYLADLVVDECSCFTAHRPWLTLEGLAKVFARNARD